MDEKRLTRLIHELDSDDFDRRKKATEALEALGEGASAACRNALTQKPSLEMHRRLSALEVKQSLAWWDDSLQRLRELRAMERWNWPARRKRVKNWRISLVAPLGSG